MIVWALHILYMHTLYTQNHYMHPFTVQDLFCCSKFDLAQLRRQRCDSHFRLIFFVLSDMFLICFSYTSLSEIHDP